MKFKTILAVALFILVAITAPRAPKASAMNLSQVVTVSKSKAPAGTTQNRAWFVEAVR